MKRQCRGCKAYLRAMNPGPLCDPCDRAIAEKQIEAARKEEERRRIRQATLARMAAERGEPAGNPTGLCRCGCGMRTPIATKTRASHGIAKGKPLFFIKGHRTTGLTATKLTAADVTAIRTRHARGETVTEIARSYGLSRTPIQKILMGKSWRHVPLEDAA